MSEPGITPSGKTTQFWKWSNGQWERVTPLPCVATKIIEKSQVHGCKHSRTSSSSSSLSDPFNYPPSHNAQSSSLSTLSSSRCMTPSSSSRSRRTTEISSPFAMPIRDLEFLEKHLSEGLLLEAEDCRIAGHDFDEIPFPRYHQVTFFDDEELRHRFFGLFYLAWAHVGIKFVKHYNEPDKSEPVSVIAPVPIQGNNTAPPPECGQPFRFLRWFDDKMVELPTSIDCSQCESALDRRPLLERLNVDKFDVGQLCSISYEEEEEEEMCDVTSELLTGGSVDQLISTSLHTANLSICSYNSNHDSQSPRSYLSHSTTSTLTLRNYCDDYRGTNRQHDHSSDSYDTSQDESQNTSQSFDVIPVDNMTSPPVNPKEIPKAIDSLMGATSFCGPEVKTLGTSIAWKPDPKTTSIRPKAKSSLATCKTVDASRLGKIKPHDFRKAKSVGLSSPLLTLKRVSDNTQSDNGLSITAREDRPRGDKSLSSLSNYDSEPTTFEKHDISDWLALDCTVKKILQVVPSSYSYKRSAESLRCTCAHRDYRSILDEHDCVEIE